MPEAPVHHVHPLGVGDVVPDFTLPDHNGTQRTLSEAVAERPVLLVFYPFAFSGICTGELSEIRDDLGAFDNDGVQVWAISCDPTPSLLAWADKEGYFFPLLSDFWPHGETARAFGVFDETTGMASRTTFLIDADGIVLDRFTSEITSQRPVERYREALAKLPAPTA